MSTSSLTAAARALRSRPRISVSTALWALLAVFHGWILVRRLADGTLLQTEVVLRWTASALVVAAFLALARGGGSLLRGRRAVALWLLVALLHAGLAAPMTPVGEALAESPLSEVPFGALGFVALPAVLSLDVLAAVAAVVALAVGAALATALSARPPLRPARARVLAGVYPPVLRRPPPAR